MITETNNNKMSEVARQRRREEWLSLVLPWAAIVGIAVVAGGIALAYPSSCEQVDEEVNDVFIQRQLYGDDGYVPPTDDYPNSQTSTYSSSMQEEHHHKPVYNEEHPPLFPLTGRDYAGFIFAVLGLMIAVSDEKKTTILQRCLFLHPCLSHH